MADRRQFLFTVSALLSALVAPAAFAQHRDRGEIIVTVPPPPPRAERVPAPRHGYIWAPGYWRWDGHHHVWVAGRWEKERPGYHWAAPRWEERDGRHHFEGGRWERG
jgi:hypothetical protein